MYYDGSSGNWLSVPIGESTVKDLGVDIRSELIYYAVLKEHNRLNSPKYISAKATEPSWNAGVRIIC
jgi:hypothetical protein